MNEERFLRHYWLLYYALYLIGVGLLLWLYWDQVLAFPLDTLAKTFAVSAGGSTVMVLLIEGGGRAVLLIPATIRKYRNEGREQGRTEGREEGLAEGLETGLAQGLEQANSQWASWFQRYTEAQARGEEFTEPPPYTVNGNIP